MSAAAWLRRNLFSSWPSTLATLVILYFAWTLLPPFLEWAFVKAIWWAQDSKACRDLQGAGACWAFIAEKYRFIIFGTYPYEQHWRPGVASALLIALWCVSALRAFWRWWLSLVWVAGLALIATLMWGGVFGLTYVENERWGGLILTLLLATFGCAFAFPLAILLALGRRDEARTLVVAALAAEPQNRAALVLEGTILLEDGDAAAAVVGLQRAVAIDPHDYLASLTLARALGHLGKDEEAAAARTRADAIRELRRTFADLHREAWERPRDAEVRRRLADIAARLGRADLERVWQDAAAAVDPAAPSIEAAATGISPADAEPSSAP